ncbi:MAG TPA: 6,7-dimethyl-8-ribityllumazine synthase [bacterium]|mgnify:CR=1 FL=1|nr:6,7-dimethyl-8-ribityllumazine synthase [bacterium]MDX9805278.1 6,7-dimethyl-8-ribityllumazine synthase [bacterium]HNZ54477.1 6,7-dimethyl-8-ribityllumazine synthase [bacterium]HOB71473.1 6,7-dimethyl-8-ribityllumazine synthase [bacterium]HOG43026.1 6,7-dimethyl-8-ribityllumazine synthase [bacterium]
MKTKTFQGELTAKGKKFGIVVSRFNSFVSEALLNGAIDCLERHGAENAEIIKVPGAFEIPFAARKAALTKKYDAIICIGAIIRGSTPHFEYIAAETVKGIAHVSLETGVYISFGVLTVDTIEQAVERAGTKAGNKGFDAALAAIEMLNVTDKI